MQASVELNSVAIPRIAADLKLQEREMAATWAMVDRRITTLERDAIADRGLVTYRLDSMDVTLKTISATLDELKTSKTGVPR